MKVFACFFENTYQFKKLFGMPHQISVPAFLCSLWSMFSSVHLKPAFGNFQDHRRVTEQIFRDTGGFQPEQAF
jgi:hypothetical protein